MQLSCCVIVSVVRCNGRKSPHKLFLRKAHTVNYNFSEKKSGCSTAITVVLALNSISNFADFMLKFNFNCSFLIMKLNLRPDLTPGEAWAPISQSILSENQHHTFPPGSDFLPMAMATCLRRCKSRWMAPYRQYREIRVHTSTEVGSGPNLNFRI